MPAGRKKKCRKIQIDFDTMPCHCYGPAGISKTELKTLEKVDLGVDELQAMVYQDIDGLTMAQGAKKLGISKTVFAGIYSSAKKKMVSALMYGQILTVVCDEEK